MIVWVRRLPRWTPAFLILIGFAAFAMSQGFKSWDERLEAALTERLSDLSTQVANVPEQIKDDRALVQARRGEFAKHWTEVKIDPPLGELESVFIRNDSEATPAERVLAAAQAAQEKRDRGLAGTRAAELEGWLKKANDLHALLTGPKGIEGKGWYDQLQFKAEHVEEKIAEAQTSLDAANSALSSYAKAPYILPWKSNHEAPHTFVPVEASSESAQAQSKLDTARTTLKKLLEGEGIPDLPQAYDEANDAKIKAETVAGIAQIEYQASQDALGPIQRAMRYLAEVKTYVDLSTSSYILGESHPRMIEARRVLKEAYLLLDQAQTEYDRDHKYATSADTANAAYKMAGSAYTAASTPTPVPPTPTPEPPTPIPDTTDDNPVTTFPDYGSQDSTPCCSSDPGSNYEPPTDYGSGPADGFNDSPDDNNAADGFGD